jgi:ABC-type sugar transport system ATPase subunit
MTSALAVSGIVKTFAGQRALDGVSLDVTPGEIHALIGHNGAGKSTLVKVIAGALTPDAGSVTIGGKELRAGRLADARAAGVAVVHQHGNLIPTLTVAENLALGNPPPRRAGLFVDWPELRRRATELLAMLGLPIDPLAFVASLRPDEAALVAIAKAVASDAQVIILDEPTSALVPREVATLFGHMHRLAARGHAFVYVSHRLGEIFEIADAATVLRDGRVVWRGTDLSRHRHALVAALFARDDSTGHDMTPLRRRVREAAFTTEPAVAVAGLSGGRASGIEFRLHRGEILGLAGLPGGGVEDVMDMLYGRRAPSAGSIRIDGRVRRLRSPGDAVRAGLACVPKDRLAEAAIGGLSVRANLSIACLTRFNAARWIPLIRRDRERRFARELIERLAIKTRGTDARIESLSGGNQQKVMIARWLGAGATVYLLDSPTAAVDVHAKSEIHALLEQLADDGAAIVFVSPEFEEYARLCDRVLVLADGSVQGELEGAAIDEQTIMTMAIGREAAVDVTSTH